MRLGREKARGIRATQLKDDVASASCAMVDDR